MIALGIRLAADELGQEGLGRRRLRDREERRLFRQLSVNPLWAEVAEALYADEIAAVPLTTTSGPALPALGDGTFADIFKRVFEWLADEENRAKLIELIKFFLSLGSLFGGLSVSSA